MRYCQGFKCTSMFSLPEDHSPILRHSAKSLSCLHNQEAKVLPKVLDIGSSQDAAEGGRESGPNPRGWRVADCSTSPGIEGRPWDAEKWCALGTTMVLRSVVPAALSNPTRSYGGLENLLMALGTYIMFRCVL